MRWTFGQILPVALVAALVGAVGYLGYLAATTGPRPGPAPAPAAPAAPPALATDAQIRDLADHPERFKGQTLTVRTFMAQRNARWASVPLRDKVPADVWFVLSAPGMTADVLVRVDLPPGDIPAATGGDHLLLTFECREGSRTAGNVATRVERAK